jgi:hypothetical protein
LLSDKPLPLLSANMNEAGLGAVAWVNDDGSHSPTAIRLASFF